MKLPRLKNNTVYIHRETGRIAVLRRTRGWFRMRIQWQLEFISSVMPEELNRTTFKRTIATEYELIGDL